MGKNFHVAHALKKLFTPTLDIFFKSLEMEVQYHKKAKVELSLCLTKYQTMKMHPMLN
jgi:hypothetical protein